jgi:hypothetical protein
VTVQANALPVQSEAANASATAANASAAAASAAQRGADKTAAAAVWDAASAPPLVELGMLISAGARGISMEAMRDIAAREEQSRLLRHEASIAAARRRRERLYVLHPHLRADDARLKTRDDARMIISWHPDAERLTA